MAPLSVLGIWREEFAKFADFPYALAVLTGTRKKKVDALRRMDGSQLQIAVVNYESVRLLEKEIRAWKPDLLLADEGHRLKNRSAACSKAMHRLSAVTPYRMLLTGTLIVDRALDVFSQYRFLSQRIFGESFPAFKLRFLAETGYKGYDLVLRPGMETAFTRRLHSIAYRVTKEQCLDLPETVDIIRHVELEPAARKIYQELVRDSFARVGDGEITTTHVLTRLLRLAQLTGGFLGDDSGGPARQISTAKMKALSDIIDEVLYENRKLVIIARFLPEFDAICDLLNQSKIGFVCIRGGVGDRDKLVAAFQNDPAVRVFVGQIAVAGLGLTLTAADTMVFYSLDYNAANHEQARARIHRVGQTNRCTYIYILARQTVDEKILKSLRDKTNLARMLVDEYRRGINPFEERGD